MACKYYVLKLLSRAPGSSSYDANMDMFPIEFQGYKLPIPAFGSSELPLPQKESKKSIAKETYENANLIYVRDTLKNMGVPIKKMPRPIKIRIEGKEVLFRPDKPEPKLLFEDFALEFVPKQIVIHGEWTEEKYDTEDQRA